LKRNGCDKLCCETALAHQLFKKLLLFQSGMGKYTGAAHVALENEKNRNEGNST